jgi:hypothetical protein
MKILSRSDFNKARIYLKTQARPLERRLFTFFFEDEPLENTIAELAQFQNDDGGYGNALEPDFRMPESSPMATNLALHIFRQIGAPSSQPAVANAVRYIVSCYNIRAANWSMVSSEVNNHPHAPWWHFDASKGNVPAESTGNPTAELLSSLLSWPELLPAGFLDNLVDTCHQRIASLTNEVGMHELSCYIQFVEALPEELRGTSEAIIKDLVSKTVARDPATWALYTPKPLLYVTSPASFLYDGLHTLVETNLDYMIDTQDPIGGWAPNWDWGGNYPEVWDIARMEWHGIITLENLNKLMAFGRLE